MFKKILLTTALFVASLSTVFAYPFYIAPTVKYQKIYATHADYSGIFPSLALGLGDWVNNWFYFAGEIFGDYRPIEISNDTDFGVNMRVKYSYGISVLPGLYLDDVVMAFLRLGIISSDFDKLEVWKSGYQAGIGLQAKLNDCWDVRAEYDYLRYNKIDDLGMPRNDVIAVGLLYKFG